MTPAQINYHFQRACLLDVAALKPGNVGWHGCGHGMDSGDFIASAAACGHSLCASGITLGERIFQAIERTRRVVKCNTNLGLVLLCAPVIHAALNVRFVTGGLKDAVGRILEQTTVDDARRVFAAIRLVQPGGMGTVETHDIRDEPTLNLRDVMRFSAGYDLVGAQYAEEYRFLFEDVVPLFVEFFARWGYDTWAAAGVYMTLLGGYPDSLIARKQGPRKAEDIMKVVTPLAKEFVGCTRPQDFERQLLDLDRYLKQDKLNPGTTADIVVSGVLIASLEGALRNAVIISSSK